MKIYIAAPWIDREKMTDIATKFEQAGNMITHKWWLTEDIKESERTVAALRTQAENDVRGVMEANVVVVINTSKSEGKATEQGVAIAMKKPIICVGTRGEHSLNVFHYLPTYRWVTSVEEAVALIDIFNWMVANASRS